MKKAKVKIRVRFIRTVYILQLGKYYEEKYISGVYRTKERALLEAKNIMRSTLEGEWMERSALRWFNHQRKMSLEIRCIEVHK